jgi:hypothetical protein
MEEKYSSIPDTMAHKRNIENVLGVLIEELKIRMDTHDNSKLVEPELSCYDKYIPMLQKTKYGTSEYFKVKKAMEEEGLKHHFAENRHHPEHWNNDISRMTLVDLVEMFADHYAASLKSDTGFISGETTNAERYKYPDTLLKIFLNTYKEYFDPRKDM